MAFVDIQNPAERKKLIAAGILGVLALFALYFAFGRSILGSSTTNVTVKISPTPKPSVSPGKDTFKLPTAEEQTFDNVTTPIVYVPGSSGAPDPGRNIFAFYEPPVPTPYSPTPIPPIKPTPTPSPTPTPDLYVAGPEPRSVYAGSKGFRLMINGDRFTADSHIYWSQTELPTVYVNPQTIYADIPATLIAQDGPRQIIVQTPDGKKYSNQVILNVEAPPKPTVQYIGMIGRKRYNNDTAYLMPTGATAPVAARLNDVVEGRFRLINITPAEIVLEDTSLGFKHHIPVTAAVAGSSSGGAPTGRPARPDNGFPAFPQPNSQQPGEIPGIPGNIQRYVPPQPGQAQPGQPMPGQNPRPQRPEQPKKDVNDDDGDGE